MSTLYRCPLGRLFGAVGLIVPLVAAPTARGDSWPADIRFASTETTAAAECECPHESPSQYCAPASCDYGYCFSCPLSDELSRRLAPLMKCMQQQGIIYAPGLTQFYQGVADGGAEQEFEYGGKVDQFLILDSSKMGLWDGMTMNMHVETRFGDDVNLEAVALAPVNVNMLYPKVDEHVTAITNLTFAQALDENVQATFGKFNALDLFYTLYPETGRGITGFMNASMVIPVAVARVVPLSFVGAGAMSYDGKKPQGGVLVYDTQNCATTSGFDDIFDNGANILGFWRFFTDLNGLPGSQGFLGIWSTGEFVAFDPSGFVIVPGQGIVANRQSGAFSLVYIFEQTLWQDCCNKSRNVTLLSQCGLADPETSPINWSGNIALQAQGFNSSRPHDSMGVGYFHTAISDDLKNLLSPVFVLQDIDGVELYYNMAVTKAFQLTSDFQVIEPADERNDTAIVVGLRGTIGF